MPVRCLAFTTTYRRPHMALCCLLQMRVQTFPVRHVLRVATDEPGTDCSPVLDKWKAPQTRIVTGPNVRQHDNYLDAIRAEPGFDDFDLFLKIDDDDFYDPDYTLNVVNDWKARRWNVSSAVSPGVVNAGQLRPGTLPGLGPIPEEGESPRFGMPATLVFDRKALACLLALTPAQEFEDRQWRRAWLAAGLDVAMRATSGYMYHIHGGNCSTAHLLDPG